MRKAQAGHDLERSVPWGLHTGNMHVEWLIIDGYSLLHRDEEYRSILSRNLSMAREAALRDLNSLSGILAERITVVFDGRSAEPGMSGEGRGIEVVFSHAGQTADSCIERMICDADDATGALVVTSDRGERETVMAAGAQSMSCGEFMSWTRSEIRRLRKRININRDHGSASRGTTLGDYFPE